MPHLPSSIATNTAYWHVLVSSNDMRLASFFFRARKGEKKNANGSVRLIFLFMRSMVAVV